MDPRLRPLGWPQRSPPFTYNSNRSVCVESIKTCHPWENRDPEFKSSFRKKQSRGAAAPAPRSNFLWALKES